MISLSPSLLLAVAAGGALGAVLRLIAQQTMASLIGLQFPWGTLLVNILGCGVIGLLTSYWTNSAVSVSPEIRAGLTVGVLGALTTFSAFSLDSITLYQSGEMMRAFYNVFFNLLLCLSATAFGVMAGARLAS